MKKLFIAFLFFTINTAYIFSQENLKKIEQYNKLNIKQHPDSLSDSQSDIISHPQFTPDYNGIEHEMQPILQESISLTPNQKNTFLNSQYAKFVIPTALITYGIATRGNQSLRNLDTSTNHEIGEHLSYSIPYDDYIQFAPAVAVYGLDLLGVKAKHSFRDRTIVMATSHLIMGTIVQTMKSKTYVQRPDGSSSTSFPSGHTATAFVGAHILFKEYQDVSPWIGIGGYTVATATGTLRVLNKKHWVSDVVTGAGVGILSVEISYILLPVFDRMLGNKGGNKHSLALVPMVEDKGGSMGMSYTF